MEFNHHPYQPGETIAAIATPPGEGGIAIIRISGKRALEVASSLFSGNVKSYKSHTAHYGKVLDHQGRKIDEALLLVLLGKRSFTGEDTVEIQCHGGMIAAKRVLERALQAGARAANPGEFSFKAFMNGKLDLAQAEAIQQLICAKNEKAFALAGDLLEGVLSKKIYAFQQEIVSVAAIFEAWVDFPDEGLEFATQEEISEKLQEIIGKMEELLSTYHDGRRLNQGIHLSIIGAPNVGKSSLMNALLQKERAIVTPIAGTTRDVLEEDVTLNGVHFRLIDTAGIRQTPDLIEREGILRSRRAMERADLILFVLDASRQMQEEELPLLKEIPPEKTIAIWNKGDIQQASLATLPFPHVVTISAKERVGLNALKAKIDEVIWKNGRPGREDLLLSHLRHKEALARAKECCLIACANLNGGISPEFLVFELRQALFELGTIMGTNVNEEILSSIFSQFCIGK